MIDPITLSAPGKINLLLKIGEKRGDGKHEVLTVLCKTGICDQVTLTKAGEGISVFCSDPLLPTDENNLACKAAKEYFAFFGISGGVKIEIEKHIPVKAGMGGGSADAGAVLLGMKELFGKGTVSELANLAASLGSDVPFFVYPDRVMLGKESGDVMTPVNAAKAGIFGVFLSLSEKISTGRMYSLLDEARGEAPILSEKSAETLLCAISAGDAEGIMRTSENDFETVAGEKETEILLSAGAEKTLLCGSGPTVCGLFRSEEAAREAAKKIGNNAFYSEIL